MFKNPIKFWKEIFSKAVTDIGFQKMDQLGYNASGSQLC